MTSDVNSETADRVEEFLAHHGVLGMKWGVRKARSGSSNGESLAKPAWAKNAAKSKGSKGAEAAAKITSRRNFLGRKVSVKTAKQLSEDAIAFKALKKKAKEHGLDSLTNAEVKRVNDRFNLEQSYKKAFPKKKNPLVQLLINEVLVDIGAKSLAQVPQPHTAKALKFAEGLKIASSVVKSVQPQKK